MKFVKLFLGSLLSCLSFLAAAANISVNERGDYQYPIITVSGEITNSDGDRFSILASKYTNAIVELSSPGGSLLSGIQIGTIIRLRAFHTLVRNENVCASACAYAWLAGTQRYAEIGSKIGFHAAYVMNQGVAKETGSGNALLGSYLSRIALSDTAIVYFTSAAPQEMAWLTSQTAQQLGLNVQDFSTVRKNSAATKSFQPPSSTPAPVQSPDKINLDRAAAVFVQKYFAHWSADDGQALRFLEEMFDDRVDFYGASRLKRDIIKEKIAFIKRWPARVYVERQKSVQIFCNQATKQCSVTGLIDWEARSSARNAVAAGVSSFSFVLDFTRGDLRVVSEDGAVIERRKT